MCFRACYIMLYLHVCVCERARMIAHVRSIEGWLVLFFLVMCGAMWCVYCISTPFTPNKFFKSTPAPPIAVEARRVGHSSAVDIQKAHKVAGPPAHPY